MVEVVDRTIDLTFQSIMREATNKNHWHGWIVHRPLQIYIRLTERYFEGGTRTTLDIANIQVDPRYHNKGIFSGLLDKLEAAKLRDVLYIENVLATSDENQIRLCNFLERRGFMYYGSKNELKCMVKFLREIG
jgi:GNAT superfamily N-acetyltransferase